MNRSHIVVILLALSTLAGTLLFRYKTAIPAYSAGSVFYVDCNGSDANAGNSETKPWKTLTKANAAPLQPGDKLLFKRGCIWQGRLKAAWNGTSTNLITISAYGNGNLPIIQSDPSINSSRVEVSGRYQIVESLDVRTINPQTDPGCKDQTIGYFVGFNLVGSSAYNVIRLSKVSGHTIGIHITDNSNHNKILNNEIYLNSVMNHLTPDSSPDLGAWGMDLKGDDNEIAYNYFHDNNGWCAYDFSIKPGNAIEIYNGDRNFIHHNKVVNDRVFSEVGHAQGKTSDDNIWAYNSFISSTPTSRFLTLHVAGNAFGPVFRSKIYNNSVYLTGPNSTGVGGGESGTIVKNNILYAPDNLTTLSTLIQSNNIFWSPDGTPQVKGLGPGDKKADPQFVNAAAGDLRLKATSPAVNSGVDPKVGISTDLAGNSVPNGAFDIGAYEYGATSVSPTPQLSITSPPPTATGGPVPTTPGACSTSGGDINCDGVVDISDFEIWRKEYTGILSTRTSDIDGDGSVSISDFEVWRSGFYKE